MIELISAFILIMVIVIIIPLYVYYLNEQIPKQKIIFENPNLPKNSNIKLYRDIPFNNDIFRAYAIAVNFKIITNKSNLIGALLLRWIKLEYITVIEDYSEYGFALKIPQTLLFNNVIEQGLLNILRLASKENHILEYQEFKTYCSSNSQKIFAWFNDVDYYSEELLKMDGYIKEEDVSISKIFNRINRLDHHKIITKSATERAVELLGLKKYLLDYSNITDKSSIEVTLWDSYLVFAQLLGIAKSVDSDFIDLYLDYVIILDKYRLNN